MESAQERAHRSLTWLSMAACCSYRSLANRAFCIMPFVASPMDGGSDVVAANVLCADTDHQDGRLRASSDKVLFKQGNAIRSCHAILPAMRFSPVRSTTPVSLAQVPPDRPHARHMMLSTGAGAWPLTERVESLSMQFERLLRLSLAKPSSEVVRAICRCHPGPHASMYPRASSQPSSSPAYADPVQLFHDRLFLRSE